MATPQSPLVLEGSEAVAVHRAESVGVVMASTVRAGDAHCMMQGRPPRDTARLRGKGAEGGDKSSTVDCPERVEEKAGAVEDDAPS